jgi:hypothetical protein
MAAAGTICMTSMRMAIEVRSALPEAAVHITYADCPTSTIHSKHITDQQILSQIEGLLAAGG